MTTVISNRGASPVDVNSSKCRHRDSKLMLEKMTILPER